MYYKISPFIVAFFVVIIISLVGFGVKVFVVDKKANSANQTQNEVSEILPELDLSVNTEEENQEKVTITAVASIEDETGIKSITLPDGSTVRSSSTTFDVTKNGNYTFKANGVNGQSTSLTIEVNNVHEASSESPYIPSGFTYVGGEVNTGYVIQDSYGNEYVWVPVSSGKLTRNTMLDTNYEESSSTASGLVNSVAQNYGFYIARYEASLYEVNGEKIAASIANKSPWVNVSYIDANNAVSRVASTFGYEDYQIAMINSYAWDTVLNWIDSTNENYSTNTSFGNYSGNTRNTGTTESDIKNNICDLAGNVREWTTEIYKYKAPTTNTSKNKSKNKNTTNEEVVSETVNYRVVRGGSANLSRTASSHTGYKENVSDPYWGFRTILYK